MMKKDKARKCMIGLCLCGFCISAGKIVFTCYGSWEDSQRLDRQQAQLMEQRAEGTSGDTDKGILAAGMSEAISAPADAPGEKEPEILPEYRSMYEQNHDLIGWLSIEGTGINYPVMQTPEDENYYLYRDFYGEDNHNGCLIMDTDSTVGSGAKAEGYFDGAEPSANLIVHGHNMKSGEMFGNLDLYQEESYGKEHSIICFDSLYEHRKYELIAVFYSQVYRVKDKEFKYYKFFEAGTQEEFDNWYTNIKKLSLYDTGAKAEPGDEFITLNCCAYHVENGRFVVVGRRIE
ncbi:class B sortase [Petralouisia muris]|jgi:sortase B|uniref:Class B sortase n=1 Tax=Petralouisia muris TaxID=3032872 RepID=A0AC61RSZ5_9FIRM|nr:class B sortase [Petralouisia muris]TGY95030.1 class B sortase [Petralouisia muris]